MENENRKRRDRIFAILLMLNLLAAIMVIGFLLHGQQAEPRSGLLSAQMEAGEKYILYIGLNDKDAYTQLIPTEEAREIVNAICAKHTGGYTVSDACGGWVDETGTLTQENTLVYAFYQIDEELLIAIMDEILEALNQNSILVERAQAVSSYYSGTGG